MKTRPQINVLLICFSLSGQTNILLHRLAAGLEETGVTVCIERLRPLTPLRFPFGSIRATLFMMLVTFFRRRWPIGPLSENCSRDYDLIVLAGPTWSYHPSGPILALLDRDGPTLFNHRTVIPLISCRGYWRMHWYGLRSLLTRNGATVPNRIIFTHPSKEPWRTLGVFLKLAGRTPEKSKFLGRHYPKYGHVREQQDEAHRFGRMLGKCLVEGTGPDTLDFRTTVAMP